MCQDVSYQLAVDGAASVIGENDRLISTTRCVGRRAGQSSTR